MGLFHVYVEAPERTPEAISQLARTISEKYGVPVADLERRLTAGRFRVKANVDRITADAYAKALSESGAIVKIEDALPTQPSAVVSNVSASSEAPGPAARAPAIKPVEKSAPVIGTPILAARSSSSSLPPAAKVPGDQRSGSSSLPAQNAARPSSPALPAATGKSQQVPTSGLSAAFTDSAQNTDLGALSSDSLSLASLDGDDTGSQLAIQDFAPPPSVTAPAPPVKKAKPKDEPLDLFAPPEAAEDAAFKVEIAADDVAHRAARMNTPPAGVMAVPAAPGPATPQLAAVKKRQTPAVGAPIIVSPDAQETPRWRFAAGVILAIILGFIPAHLVAASREASAFAKIDQAVHDLQDAVDTPDSYEALDGHRDKFLARKQSERQSIAMQSMLIWAVVGAGIAFAWFRAVPWGRLGKQPA